MICFIWDYNVGCGGEGVGERREHCFHLFEFILAKNYLSAYDFEPKNVLGKSHDFTVSHRPGLFRLS